MKENRRGAAIYTQGAEMHVGTLELAYGCNIVSSELGNDVESSQDRPLRSSDLMSTILPLFHF